MERKREDGGCEGRIGKLGGGRRKVEEEGDGGGRRGPKGLPCPHTASPWVEPGARLHLPSNWATGWREPSDKVPHPPLLKNGCHLGPARCRSQSARLKFLGDRTGPAALLGSCDLQCHRRRDRSRTGHPTFLPENPGECPKITGTRLVAWSRGNWEMQGGQRSQGRNQGLPSE